MKKYIVTIEFRYGVIPKSEYHTDSNSRTITLGIYDNLRDAIDDGNTALNKLKKYFCFREKFSETGFLGIPKTLVVDLSRKKTGVSVFCQITTLDLDNLETAMEEVVKIDQEYRQWKSSKED